MAETRARSQGRDIEFLAEVDETIGDVEGDERHILQSLRSLLSNAVKFTGDGGTVGLRARNTGDGVVISVSDPGIGIEEADRERIFESFWQAGSEYARRGDGAGLGLAFTKRFVEPPPRTDLGREGTATIFTEKGQ